ncbi:hypothetical protein RJ639_032389 [Escallonia herrerae]|uniref:NECAP PHear domain-containing protein n=1 Tax=Escallonia herrerae TaxID=1293975 RepID=A0AA88WSY3_9ASTE|nr:hypothetical protein RJ639_032389 [Escallonia herrerae]
MVMLVPFILYRADEWDINKWAWEGILKVTSKGEECIIKLEDKTTGGWVLDSAALIRGSALLMEKLNTGELYARAFLRDGEPHPVEPVIDSSRYFVLRVEENIVVAVLGDVSSRGEWLMDGLHQTGKDLQGGAFQHGGLWQELLGELRDMSFYSSGGRLRHAFIGIGFRERPEAYDFQAALHDHMKYLNKKKAAEEMEQHYQKTSSADYSLKDGETLVLQIKNKGGRSSRSKFFEQGLNNVSLEEKGNGKEALISIKPPPPPPALLSPSPTTVKSPSESPSNLNLEELSKDKSSGSAEGQSKESEPPLQNQSQQEIPDDDFGDFQTAV